MRKCSYILFIFIVMVNVNYGDKIAEFDVAFKGPYVIPDANQFYIVDGRSCVIHAYSWQNFSLLFKFGSQGEGPGEFRMRPRILSTKQNLLIQSPGKVSYFTKDGKLIKEILTPGPIYRLKTINNFFIATKVDFEDSSNTRIKQLIIYDDKFKPVKTIFEEKEPAITFKRGGPKKRIALLFQTGQMYDVFKDLVILCDTTQGFHFTLFNKKGEKIREIKRPYTKLNITDREKKEYFDRRKKRSPARWKDSTKRFNFVFPKYYPAIRNFEIYESKIFVYTYKKIGEDKELVILDFNGNQLFKGPCKSKPNGMLFKGYIYYVKENEDT